MADQEVKKKRTFRKFTYRGIELEDLMKMKPDKLTELFPARQKRRFSHGIKHRYLRLIKKLRAAKLATPYGEKPVAIKTHLRNTIIVPEMIGSIVAVHGGKTFNEVEIKPEMVGHYLGEFSLTYRPVRHGRPGIGATASSKFVPIK